MKAIIPQDPIRLVRCGLGRWALPLVAFFSIGSAQVRAQAQPTVAPPAKWVLPQPFERTGTTRTDPGEDHWLLMERQINAAENETFSHGVRQLLTLSGVQKGASVIIDFNPEYQSLTIHWVRIWRGGEVLDRLHRQKINLIQQERDLDNYLFNGQKSAVLVMDDVRVGDIVDYAWSVKGWNPIFKGKFSAAVDVQLAQPVERLRTRVLWPAQRRLYAKNHGGPAKAVTVQKKETVEYTWEFRNVPGLRLEDSLPVWYDPQPWVQLSEYRTWSEVNQWALELFQNTAPLSPELQKKIAEWRPITSHEDQILAVLRFLQDEIRHLGIEIGASSHKPSDPSTVFAQRFGDGKDKALLFVTILRALGIEASPVLVNASRRHTIAEWQPSALAFNHCIARVESGGKSYWLDPTARSQGGSLAAHDLADYGRGLVVAPGTTDLTVIPLSPVVSRTTTSEYFQLRGKREPADLEVITVAEGADADAVRAMFASLPHSEIEKQYMKFYSDLYPGTILAGPMIITDDERQNRIETTELYSIEQAWTASDNNTKYACKFFPATIESFLKKPDATGRKMPVGVRFPVHRILRTEVILPDLWLPDVLSQTVSDPAFFFQMSKKTWGSRINLEYEYRSLTDSVPANRAAQYLQRLNEASQALGYSVMWQY